jgi:hypothetical protein
MLGWLENGGVPKVKKEIFLYRKDLHKNRGETK